MRAHRRGRKVKTDFRQNPEIIKLPNQMICQ
jgi:hypothetical protein